MKARIRFYPRGMTEDEQLKILGADADVGWGEPFVIVSFPGIGIGVSINEALAMGLTDADLKAAREAPQEFEVKLLKGGI